MPPSDLPDSAVLAAWLAACLTGRAHPEEMVEAMGADVLHLITGLEAEPLSPILALGVLRSRGAHGAALALPVPGDPVGLAGPLAFNQNAMEASEAVLVVGAGIGLVPTEALDVVTWQAEPAEDPRPLDPREAATALRLALAEATSALVALDVARWQPEIADVLVNLRHRRPTPLPTGLGPERLETVERAALCREIVALARESDGSATSSYEMEGRRAALDPLGRAARHALVAAVSG